MRCFLAADATKEVKDKAYNIQKSIRDLKGRIKLVRHENLHWTLKFLGNISSTKAMEVKEETEKIAKNSESFEIEVKGVGVFPKISYIKTLWIGVGNGKEKFEKLMNKLNKRLARSGFKREPESRLTPHLTIARVKSIKPQERERLRRIVKKFRNESLCKSLIGELKLYRSSLKPEGPSYKVLKKFQLEK